jgi:hypothetical protein
MDTLVEQEVMELIVVIERGVGCVTEIVKKGLPLTRKKVKFEEGISKVTLRSL